MQHVSFGPFLGVVTTLEVEHVGHSHATDTLNAWLYKGSLLTRRGYRNTKAAQGGFSNCRGFYLALGYNTSYQFKAEYISFETLAGVLKPYSRTTADGTATVITDGGTPLTLTDGEWYGANIDGYFWAHRINAGGVYKHEVGNNSSWDPVDRARPADPPTAPSTAFTITEDISTTTPAGPVAWAGASGATVVELNGVGTVPDTYYDSVSGSSLVMRYAGNDAHTTAPSGTGTQFYRLDLSTTTAGNQDWSAVNSISFTLDTYTTVSGVNVYQPGPLSSISVVLQNSVGTRVTMNVTVSSRLVYSSHIYADYCRHEVTITFPSGYTPADWTITRYLEFQCLHVWTGSPPSGTNTPMAVYMSQITPATSGASAPTTAGTTFPVKFGYVYYDSLRDAESATIKETAWINMESPKRYWDSAKTTLLGNTVAIGFPVSADSWVDKTRIYFQDQADGVWRLVAEVLDTATPYTIDMTYASLLALPERIAVTVEPVGDITCLCGYRGWAVYGYAKGKTNIRHSKVGQPHILVRTTDDLSLIGRPADFTLSDDFADEPMAMHQAGDSLIVIGKRGIYSQTGDYPSSMTPFRKFAYAKGGFCPRTSCRFKDDQGVAGVAYLANDQDTVWFAVQRQSTDGETGRIVELTPHVRGLVTSFLGGGSALDSTKARMFVDDREEALWLVHGTKAMVFRRAPWVGGGRYWELYQYAFGTGSGWQAVTAHQDYGIRGIRSDGKFDELEYNTSTNFSNITGTARDDGQVPATAYWTTKKDYGQRRRLLRFEREGSSLVPTLTITPTFDGTAYTAKTIATTKRGVRFFMDAVGFSHLYKISWPETGSTSLVVAVLVDAGDREDK